MKTSKSKGNDIDIENGALSPRILFKSKKMLSSTPRVPVHNRLYQISKTPQKSTRLLQKSPKNSKSKRIKSPIKQASSKSSNRSSKASIHIKSTSSKSFIEVNGMLIYYDETTNPVIEELHSRRKHLNLPQY